MDKHLGRIIKLPDNIDTDIIIPTQYMTIETISEMSQYAFAPLRPDIPKIVKKGDILVCGKNFGCGSSREQAPEIIKELGIFCVIAKSFARIFYRNSINNGLMLIENSRIYDLVQENDNVQIDILNQKIIIDNQNELTIPKIPGKLLDIIKIGGLVNYYKKINNTV